jgi:Flp pilus assembly secretin CpaC
MVTEKKARVISAPRVAVIDGNEANINLGEEVPIPSIDSAGRLTFTFKPIGVILHIVPKANRDGLITTKVEPEVSAVAEFLQTSSGPVPRINTRKASTTVTVRSGSSIVIGGLISAAERRTVIKVPLLGDIPIIGALFRTTTTDRQETEVIFVVTVQIAPSPGAPGPAPSPSP